MTLTLTLPNGIHLYNGKQVTFQAPCKSEGLTGLVVEGVTYDLVNATGTTLVPNSFSEGALVSVIFDTALNKAYVQNADTNAYLEDRFRSMQSGGGYNPDDGDNESSAVVSMSIVKSGSTVTFTTKMDDGGTHTDIINLNENEYPVTIVSDGVTIPVTWEGFDG